jgi:hypothetical protein
MKTGLILIAATIMATTAAHAQSFNCNYAKASGRGSEPKVSVLLYRTVKVSNVLESYLASLTEVSEERVGIEARQGQLENVPKERKVASSSSGQTA